MLQRIKRSWLFRRIKKSATETINNHRGFSARGWDASPIMHKGTRRDLADAVQAWLIAELPFTATPYGIAQYRVILGYAHMENAQRTYLGQESLAKFDRNEALTAIEQLRNHIIAADWTGMPTLTTLEVYFISYGDILKPFLDAEAK